MSWLLVLAVVALYWAMPGHALAATASNQAVVVVESSVNNNVTLNGSGTNFTLDTSPSNGTLMIYSTTGYVAWVGSVNTTYRYVRYTPTPMCVGSDSFVWRTADSNGTSSNATCSITINTNQAPIANAQNLVFSENSADNYFNPSYSDSDGRCQIHVFTFLTVPSHGILKFSGLPLSAGRALTNSYTPTLAYAPEAGYTGSDSFTWRVGDGVATSAARTVTITISANNPPKIAVPSLSLTCLQNSSNDMYSFLAYNHTDVGQTMTYTLIQAPTNGTLRAYGVSLQTGSTPSSLQWTYFPGTNVVGADGFVWSVSDSVVTTTGIVSIAVVARSTPPAPPVFKTGVKLMDGSKPLALGTQIVNGRYNFAGSARSSGSANNLQVVAAPELVDWNNDGLLDLVVGEADGRVALFINHGTRNQPLFNGYSYLTLSNGKPILAWPGACICNGGNPECSAPRVVDWDNDGRKDLLVGECSDNSAWGVNLFVYFNEGTDKSPIFDEKISCRLISAGFPTVMPFICDWNGDGISDLISGDGVRGTPANTNINVFIGSNNDHGPRSIYNCIGNSEMFNWDEYSPSDSFRLTAPTLKLTNACPGGSRKSVVAIDWTGRGKLDLVVGMQDGTIWYAPNVGTRNYPAYTNYVRLQAGGSNIVIGSASKVGQDDTIKPTINEARLAVGDLDGDGLLDLVVGDVNGAITVFSQYDPKPVAVDQNVLAMPNAAKAITLAARVDSGNAIAFTRLSNPAHGSLSGSSSNYVYSPNADFQGRDSFAFKATDITGDSRTGTVWITVKPHPPAANWISPATLRSTAVMNMNTSLVITLTATDDGTESLAYRIVMPPTHGSYSISSNIVVYTPHTDYTGPDSFAYQANDGYLDSNVMIVNLDVCVRAVNFQPPTVAVPSGYLMDTGGLFSVSRGYGWDNTNVITNALASNPDPRMDTFVCSKTSSTWTCNMPSNGTYYVTLGYGFIDNQASEPLYHDMIYVQGSNVVTNASPSGSLGFFLAGQIPVAVTSGQLTVTIGDNGAYPSRLGFLEVRNAYRPAGVATFAGEDDTTQGSWEGTYGADGYTICTGLLGPGGADTQTFAIRRYDPSYFALLNIPSYAMISGLPVDGYTPGRQTVCAFPTPDIRALQYPMLDDDSRIAVYWNRNFISDINFTDGQTHRVAIYCMAWSWANDNWALKFDILDGRDNTVLDTRTLSHFVNGKWLVWNLEGHTKIRVTNANGGSGGVCGIFFGTSAAPTIDVQPLYAAVQTGEEATFSVNASGNALFYQWQRSDDIGFTWTDILGACADSYSFVTSSGDNAAMFRCVISNNYGEVISDEVLLAVNDDLPLPPVISSPLTVTAVFLQPFSYTITAANNPTYFDAYLPSLNFRLDMQSGVISASQAAYFTGTPSSGAVPHTGTVQIVIIAGNAGGEDVQVLNLIVNTNTAPVVTSDLTATGMAGVPFTYTITGSQNPTTYRASGLPVGLTLNPATGVISGTPAPSATGTANVTIGAGNTNGTGLARLVLTILGAPVIAKHPADLSVVVGQPAALNVLASGTAPLFYQWMKNGTNISGATNTTFMMVSVALADAGVYSVSVSNSIHGVTSGNATLTVTTVPIAPTIANQPTNLSVVVGQPAIFNAVATGTAPLFYQWMKNGTNIPGATSATFVINSATLTNAGVYRLSVSNCVCAVASSNAALSVSDACRGWWKMDESSGIITVDSSGSCNAGTVQGAAVWTNGVIQGGLNMNGVNNYLSTTVASTNPNVFTLALWFRTTSVTGGRLLGFSKTKTGGNTVSAGNDRHLYLNNGGNVVFGVYPGSYQTIVSPLAYNDGRWHHAAATLSGAGMALNIDGSCVATKASVTNGMNYAGYWRCGYDMLNGWFTTPSSNYFRGTVDDIRVYDRALSVAEISGLTKGSMNGISIPWVIRYFGGATPDSHPADDPDGDGLSNWEEYIAGTDPTDQWSGFRVSAFAGPTADRQDSGGFTLSWGSTTNGANLPYGIERSTNLVGGVWELVDGNVPRTPPMNTWTDANPPSGVQCFYRIIATNAP